MLRKIKEGILYLSAMEEEELVAHFFAVVLVSLVFLFLVLSSVSAIDYFFGDEYKIICVEGFEYVEFDNGGIIAHTDDNNIRLTCE